MTVFRFIKGAAKYDRLAIVRADGTVATVDCPKQRIIPHDMVHHAVEAIVGAQGFVARVDAGETAAFEMQGNDESDGVERLVEVAQADAWSGGSDAQAFIDLYHITCAARRYPPLPIDAATVNAIRARIAELQLAWDALPVGGELTL